MQENIKHRIQTLKDELKLGQDRLDKLGKEQAKVRDTMLRISGAIQVLEEILEQKAEPEPLSEESNTDNETM